MQSGGGIGGGFWDDPKKSNDPKRRSIRLKQCTISGNEAKARTTSDLLSA